jgi:putative peptidoglycan lipid II flippase
MDRPKDDPGSRESRGPAGGGVVRGFANIGLGTLVSRGSGFVREIVTAALFGAGTSMDIFVAAFTIPNLLCRALGEQAVEAAFMPVFKGLHSRGETGRAWRLASRTFAHLTLVLVAIVIVGIVVAPFLVNIVVHGFRGENAEATVRMTRLMFPFGLAIGLAALMGAILLAFKRYRVYSLAPVLLNVGIVVSVLTLSGRLGYVSLAVGVLVGGLLQFLVQVPFVSRLARRDGQRLIGRREADGAVSAAAVDSKQVARLAGPVLIAAAVQRVSIVVDRTIASFLAPGSISSLYYSFRLMQLPFAILALAVGRAVAPVLAEQHALGKHREFGDTVLSGIRMNLAYILPVTLLSVWFAEPVVGLVYQRGAFDDTDLAMTASALAMYALGLAGSAGVFLFVRVFAARLNTKTPVKVSLGVFAFDVALKLILVRTPLRHAGLALATSISLTVHSLVLYAIHQRTSPDAARIVPRDLAGCAWRVAAAGGALLAVLWAVDGWAGMSLADQSSFGGRAIRVVVGTGAGVAAYAATAFALGIPEVRKLLPRRWTGREV